MKEGRWENGESRKLNEKEQVSKRDIENREEYQQVGRKGAHGSWGRWSWCEVERKAGGKKANARRRRSSRKGWSKEWHDSKTAGIDRKESVLKVEEIL
jgi:hypothetical protein